MPSQPSTPPAEHDVVQDDFLTAVWRWLSSIRGALWLFVLVIVASFAGELVPQGRGAEFYVEAARRVFGTALGGTVGRAITLTGLDHVYNSWWYVGLLLLVLTSTVACAVRSVARARGRSRPLSPEASADRVTKMGAISELTLDGEPLKVARLAEDVLASLGYESRRAVVAAEKEPDAHCLVGQRRRYAAWGTVVAHFSFVLLAAGSIIGRTHWFSFERIVVLSEGERWTDPGGQIGFDLELTDFYLEYYEEEDAVRSYVSELTAHDASGHSRSRRVEVNRPLHYGGVGFYQSDWGLDRVVVRAVPPEGEPEELLIGLVQATPNAKWFVLDPDARGGLLSNGWAVVAHRFYADAEQPGPGEEPEPRGMWPRAPLLGLFLAEGHREGAADVVDLGWLAPGHPLRHGDWTFEWGDLVHYSGLQARRDPGIPLVWAGFIAATLGLCAVFYLASRTLRVRVTALEGGRCHVLIGAFARALGDPASDTERFCEALRKRQQQG